ncbi:MAG: hypothetical protein Kow0040_29520 [Thermogutta sp.]
MEGNGVDKSIVDRLRMDLDRLIEGVAEMRHAQREYFRTRSNTALNRARKAEKAVDAILADAATTKLF